MAKVLITESTLEDIADAIRVKANTNRTYKPSEMAIAIYNLDDIHQPIEINVPQSEHQTVSVNAKLFSASDIQTEHTTSFSVNFPPSIPITASVIPDTGYEGGTLNQSSLNAFWGGTINFTVTPATFVPNPVIDIQCESTYDSSNETTYITLTIINDGNVPLLDINVECEETGDIVTISYLDVNSRHPINIEYDFEQDPLIDSITVVVNTDDPVSYSTTETFEIEGPVTYNVTQILNVVPSRYASELVDTVPARFGPSRYLDPYQAVVGTAQDGYAYDLAFPPMSHWSIEPLRWTGTISSDTTLSVTYTKSAMSRDHRITDQEGSDVICEYSLTINGVTTTGSAALVTVSGYYGDSYTLTVIPPSGYQTSRPVVNGRLTNSSPVSIFITPQPVVPDFSDP